MRAENIGRKALGGCPVDGRQQRSTVFWSLVAGTSPPVEHSNAPFHAQNPAESRSIHQTCPSALAALDQHLHHSVLSNCTWSGGWSTVCRCRPCLVLNYNIELGFMGQAAQISGWPLAHCGPAGSSAFISGRDSRCQTTLSVPPIFTFNMNEPCQQPGPIDHNWNPLTG